MLGPGGSISWKFGWWRKIPGYITITGHRLDAPAPPLRSQLANGADSGYGNIARGDLTEEIAALKSEPGGEIFAHGGAAFVQALSRHGLIDEYRLVIHPVALGDGLPLFSDLAKPLRLDLAEAKDFPGGTVIHVYQPIGTTG